MQGETHLPQEVLAVEQLAVLGPVEETVAGHLEQCGSAEVAAGDPGQGLDVPKAAGIALEIGFQLVGGAEKLLVAQALLLALGAKEGLARPEVLGLGGGLQLLEPRLAPGDVARLDKVGGDSDIAAPLLDALAHVAHRLPDFQLEIPQQGDELADAQPQHLVQLVPFIEDEQVDVGVGVQFAPAIAAHRDQGQAGLVEAELVPEPCQQRIHVFGAGGHQFDDVVAGIEALVQPDKEAAQILLAVVTGELVVG